MKETRAWLKEYQAILLRVVSARYNVSIDESIVILFKALRDTQLREEVRGILRNIERNNRMVSIWLGDAPNYLTLRKIGKIYSKPVWYVLDILIASIEKEANIFQETFKLMDVVL